LCDRFFDSTLAYQGYGREKSISEIKICNKIAVEGIVPDLTFLLDLPPEKGLERVKVRGLFDRIEQEDILFHRRVREGFLQIAREEPERFVILDALLSKETLHSLIISEIERRFEIGKESRE
jgi:dTMP kinase